MNKILLILLASILCLSLTQKKTKKSKTPPHVERYIQRFLKTAKYESKKFNIPVAITLSQGILESQAGKSLLTRKYNNHFGIKWTGKGKYAVFADERPDCRFRVYSTAWESYRAHSILLTTNRYKHLTKLPKTNYKRWARGLKKAGYATDPKYAERLIQIIEQYDLAKYDR